LRQNGSAQGGQTQEYVDISSLPDEAMGRFASNPQDVEMTSISNQVALGRATSPPSGRLGPICSSFRRLDGVVYEFTA